MNAPLRRLSLAFLAAFALVALAVGYWGLAVRSELLARDDNPRRVLAEQQIKRGQIIDRDGNILAETRLGSDGIAARLYPHPEAASAVGYYSLRFGVGGLEAEYDDALRGSQFVTVSQATIDRILHRPPVGGDVRVTIGLAAQQAADAALGNNSGAVVALDAASGDVLALVSHPSFDPATLDDRWDALRADPASPLLNRATQGLYQPGTIFEPIMLAEALNAGLASPDDPWQGDPQAQASGASLPCAATASAPIATVADAFMWGCPGPFQAIGVSLGSQGIAASFDDFGLSEAPAFNLPTLGPPQSAGQLSPGLAAIGQEDLTVTPLRMALVAAAFAQHGLMPAPRLVSAIRAPGGDWQPVPPHDHPRGTISPAHADSLAALMQRSVQAGAPRAAFSEQADIRGSCGLAISGPGRAFHTWFIGFVNPAHGNPAAIVVLLENQQNCEAAARIGRQVLLAAIQFSK